jgi:hypothetical protein
VSAKERDRRRKARRKSGVIVVALEIQELEVELALQNAGFLRTDTPASREDLAGALARVVRVWAREATRGSTR